MNADEHRAVADSILIGLQASSGHDAQWAQFHATRALAHATLAGLLEPAMPGAFPRDSRFEVPCPGAAESAAHRRATTKFATDHDQVYGEMSGADKLPQVIAYQGQAVKTPTPCGTPFTKGHVAELHAELQNTDEPPGH